MANVKVIVKAIACADGSVSQNGSPLFDVASGGTFDLITKLDGVVEDGTWDGVDTLDFTSAACSPVTFQINAVNKESLSSGSTFNLITKLDGAVNSGSYDAPTDTLSFTSANDLTINISVAINAVSATFTVAAITAGTITAVNAGGLGSFVIKKNAGVVTAPFTMAIADVMLFEFSTAASATTIVLTGTF